MEEIITQDAPAESSPALEVPRDGAAYAEWRQTGKFPEAKPKEAPAPSPESEKIAPVSETGKGTQEKKPTRDKVASRADELRDLLDGFKELGLTPSEVKQYLREKQQPKQAVPEKATEKTENPAEPKPPKRPKLSEWTGTMDEYDDAQEKYIQDLIAYNDQKRAKEEQQKASLRSTQEKLQEASTRYGAEASAVIQSTARTLVTDQQIPQAVKSMIDRSPVWSDLCFVLGSGDELTSFIELAKSDPGSAIEKVVLMQQGIKDELAKGKKQPAAEDLDDEATERDESGRFKKSPERRESNAPPPPREVSGRGTPPPDPVDRAVKDNDVRAYMRAQNARDLARLRG